MTGRRLALITPIRNEKDNLGHLKETVLRQDMRPDLWVIVVGKSDDGSLEAARETFSDLDWVQVLPQESYAPGHGHKNFARGVNDGLRRILELEAGRPYQYISKIDATVDLDQDYFQRLAARLDSDEVLAIVCGREGFTDAAGKGVPIQPSGDEIIGFNDNRLYRRDFLVEMGGYPISISPDTVLPGEVHQNPAGGRWWTRHQLPRPEAGLSKEGSWKGYFEWGRGHVRPGLPSAALTDRGRLLRGAVPASLSGTGPRRWDTSRRSLTARAR